MLAYCGRRPSVKIIFCCRVLVPDADGLLNEHTLHTLSSRHACTLQLQLLLTIIILLLLLLMLLLLLSLLLFLLLSGMLSARRFASLKILGEKRAELIFDAVWTRCTVNGC